MAQFNDAWFHRLKAAQRDLIKFCGGIERCAEITSLSKSHVGRWNNAVDPDLMPLNAVLLLECECCIPVVTSAMAALNGFKIEDTSKKEDISSSVMQKHADAMRAMSDLTEAAADAFADGRLTPNEAAMMDTAAAKAAAAVADMRIKLAVVKAKGGVNLYSEGEH